MSGNKGAAGKECWGIYRELAHSPGRVQPGAQNEAQMVGLHLFAAETGGVEQSPETGPTALVQHLEAVLDQDAIFPL